MRLKELHTVRFGSHKQHLRAESVRGHTSIVVRCCTLLVCCWSCVKYPSLLGPVLPLCGYNATTAAEAANTNAGNDAYYCGDTEHDPEPNSTEDDAHSSE